MIYEPAGIIQAMSDVVRDQIAIAKNLELYFVRELSFGELVNEIAMIKLQGYVAKTLPLQYVNQVTALTITTLNNDYLVPNGECPGTHNDSLALLNFLLPQESSNLLPDLENGGVFKEILSEEKYMDLWYYICCCFLKEHRDNLLSMVS